MPAFDKSFSRKSFWSYAVAGVVCAGLMAAGAAVTVSNADEVAPGQKASADFITGAPPNPSEAWLLAAGGRIYDTWWEALGRDEPKGTHPAYPAAGKVKGPATFRCKECHGWDYRGKDGIYGSGSHFTGIKGIRDAAGKPPAEIAKILRDKTHGYTKEMITDAELARVAAFVSRGQHDATKFVDPKTREVKGDAERGKTLFQTTCAACHGYDGKLLVWGPQNAPEYVGTVANKYPEEFLHKVRNSHPGAMMINLRALPMADAANILAFAKGLPQK